ncbi:tubulin-specific chaperone A [Deinococcus sp. QL22]|uniref:tubulin-specific chaperone A n=1 Tax=Deinococcus sp. QL22 TaxID=2939437 RepID=UPI002016FE31|nr:tubulin-specific chaperone A [Deinococcus sp. QL22]UQN06330.1 tubulin-specific chaperone A [Deinococcus sp. QL22]
MTSSNEPPPHAVTRAIDIMFGGTTRTRIFDGFIVLGDWFGLVPAGLLVFAYLNGLDAKWPPLSIATFIAALLIGASKTIKHYKDKREKEIKEQKDKQTKLEQKAAEATYQTALSETEARLEAAHSRLQLSFEKGLEEGAEEKMILWAEVARNHEDGMINANRQLSYGMTFNVDETVSTEAINSYLKAIIACFKMFFTDSAKTPLDLTATLALVSQDRQKLQIVKIEPGGRGRSQKIPRECYIPEMTWGMCDVLRQNKNIYIPDIRDCGVSEDRGYRAVANLRVYDLSGQIMAIVNVDSPAVDAFGNEELVNQAYQYCLPIISSISLCLNDPRMFKHERL